MPSTATECSSSRTQTPTYKSSAGVGSQAAAAGFPAADPCRWRPSSSASCPVIRFDPAKRLRTLEQRGLDFLDAETVFAGPTIEVPDRRRDYGEVRIVCVGWLRGRAVIVVYTERNDIRHIISMRKANEREQRRFFPDLS